MTEDLSHLSGYSRREGLLYCEELPLDQLAERFGTPLYLYSRRALNDAARSWLRAVSGTQHRVYYAVKSCSNIAILRLFARLGLGFDIVSGGELERVLAAGGRADTVVFSGVGKSEDEMALALRAGISCFNIENPTELPRLREVAARLGKVAPISFRVNPDVDARTHPYISTGLKDNKFGVSREEALALYREAAALPEIEVRGLDCHVGSQITELEPFLDECRLVLDIVSQLTGHGIRLRHLDFGGGLGVRYRDERPPTPEQLVSALSARCAEAGHGELALCFEPGRSLTAQAGILLTRIRYLKEGSDRRFCVVDAGMNDMMRPTLYDADMPIIPTRRRDCETFPYDVVGPLCESGDWLARACPLAAREGDLLAMTGAGSYGMSMSGNYNSRPRPAEVLVDGAQAFLIRRRETVADLIGPETLLP